LFVTSSQNLKKTRQNRTKAMQRNRKSVTELDMMYMSAGWSPLTEPRERPHHLADAAPTLQCRVCRRASQALKTLAARLDDYALRIEHA
jgi:hypothetical protein